MHIPAMNDVDVFFSPGDVKVQLSIAVALSGQEASRIMNADFGKSCTMLDAVAKSHFIDTNEIVESKFEYKY